MNIPSALQSALNREGVFFQIVVGDTHLQSYHPFSFDDDPLLQNEEIAQQLIMDLFKFLVENGFFMSEDNKTLLGRI
jgi:hypothetical protein